jgi:hypothetical protein
MEIVIGQDGVLAIADSYRAIAGRSERMRPAGELVRDRWIESERRLFDEKPWAPKLPSTRKRYRYPIGHFAAGGTIRVKGDPDGPPLHLSGTLERTLTTRHALGQRDSIVALRGALDVRVGLKAQGPIAYGNFQGDRHGNREARDPMSFDPIAHRDATGDVLHWLLERRVITGGRR